MSNYNRAFFFNITYTCNNHCVDCVSHHTKKRSERKLGFKDFVSFHEIFHFSSNDRIVISGGEPSMNSELFDIITFLSSFTSHIVMYTNGRKISAFNEDTLSHVERFIIGLFGDQEIHDNYVGVSGAWLETTNGINRILHSNPTKVDVKLIIKNKIIFSSIYSNQVLKDIISKAGNISVCGHLSQGVSIINEKTDDYIEIENFVNIMSSAGKMLRLYDLPLCYFSHEFRKRIIDTYTETMSDTFNQIICGSIHSKYKFVSYNKPTFYYERCVKCTLNLFCSQVLNRYSVLGIKNQNSFLSTE